MPVTKKESARVRELKKAIIEKPELIKEIKQRISLNGYVIL